MADEQVRFDLKVDVENAIKQIKQMADNSETGAEAVKRLSNFLLKMSKETKAPLEQLRKTLQSVNQELIKSGKGGFFDAFSIGNKGIFDAEKAYTGASGAVRRFVTDSNGVVTSINKNTKAFEEADKKARGFGHGVDVIRTALGTLVAVGIFQFLSVIQKAFATLIHNIRETELAVYNLINAEKRLSEQGIDVTPKGLQEIIDSVRELVPILSQIQAEELVSRIATNVAPSLKLTNEQIKQMAEATALLYIRNKALGKSFDEVESQLTNAFLTGKVSVGINNLGVKISDQIVKDEALRLGLVKTEEEFNNLTGEMEAQIKASAMLSVVYKNATDDIQSIDEYMKTTDAAVEETTKSWNDLLTVLGQAFGPLIIEGLKAVREGVEGMIHAVKAAQPILQRMVALIVASAEAMHNLSNQLYAGRGSFINIVNVGEVFNKTFEDVMKSFDGLAEAADTPTVLQPELDEGSLQDFEDFENKIEDILQDAAEAREDLAENLSQKREDIDEEYRRKALDAEVDYGRKVEDINRDYERDIAKIKSKQREEDLRAEENYQLKLWELRMRFLMDLEDALHARDARQVIRLQKQYEIDKEALARKQGLDDKQRDADQAAELEDAAIKRDQRLADAKVEYEQKLADQRLAKQRELDDLAVWYAREQKDIETNVQRKLEALINGWIQEKKITEENAAAVYAILAKYFGPGGMTDALYAYMAQKLATPLPMPMFGGGTGPQPYWQLLENQQNAAAGGGGRRNTNRSGRGMAEGGTLIATRPTTVTFGEAGAEMASFTPLGRLGKNVGTVFSDGGGGLMGQITLAVDLSPDLEARMTKNTMNNVADIVLKVNRSKL